MQPQLPVHQLIRSYWMDRGLRYRVLSPCNINTPRNSVNGHVPNYTYHRLLKRRQISRRRSSSSLFLALFCFAAFSLFLTCTCMLSVSFVSHPHSWHVRRSWRNWLFRKLPPILAFLCCLSLPSKVSKTRLLCIFHFFENDLNFSLRKVRISFSWWHGYGSLA